MAFPNLNYYLEQLREGENSERLRDELKIHDNYFVLLYGNREDLFLKVTRAFRDSPQDSGIKESWFQCYEDEGIVGFSYEPGTVDVFVYNGYDEISEEDKIEGQVPAIFLSFHPSQTKQMEGVDSFKAMALAIAGFGDYIIRAKLTARFPRRGLEFNYIP